MAAIWTSLNHRNSVKNRPILMKFGTQHSIYWARWQSRDCQVCTKPEQLTNRLLDFLFGIFDLLFFRYDIRYVLDSLDSHGMWS